MPYTIESTILYKNLIKYRDILKFVIEMRSYTFLATTTAGLSNEKINVTSLRGFYSNDENLLERITTLLDYGNDAFLNCASPIDRDKIIADAWSLLPRLCLEGHYSRRCIEKTERVIEHLEESCPNVRLLIIELMEFASNLDLSTEIGCKIKSAISEYLKTVDYSQTPTIRDYLNQTCTVSEWYESYFVYNASASLENALKDANENFNTLLSSILTLNNDDRLPVLKCSLEMCYAKTADVEVDRNSLKRLLTENLTIDNIDYILLLLKKAGLLVDVYESVLRESIAGILENHLISQTKENEISSRVTTTHNLWALFMRSKHILSLEDTIGILTQTLIDFKNDENDIDAVISHLLFLLESAFPNYVALFKEQLETAKKNTSNGAIELKPKDENPI